MRILKKKPYITKTVGEYRFDFYYKEGSLIDTYLTIKAESGIWSMELAGNTHAYGYLLTAAMQDNDDYLHGYATYNIYISNAICTDEHFTKGLTELIHNRTAKILDEAAETAKEITGEQEAGDEALMRELAEYSDATPEEKEQIRARWKEEMKEAIKEE